MPRQDSEHSGPTMVAIPYEHEKLAFQTHHSRLHCRSHGKSPCWLPARKQARRACTRIGRRARQKNKCNSGTFTRLPRLRSVKSRSTTIHEKGARRPGLHTTSPWGLGGRRRILDVHPHHGTFSSAIFESAAAASIRTTKSARDNRGILGLYSTVNCRTYAVHTVP